MEDARKYLSADKLIDERPKLSEYTERSIFDSNAVIFWKPITDEVVPGVFDNRYFVSTDGRTYNTATQREIGLSMHRKGYKQFAVMTRDENGKPKQKTKKLHRYIMETFCPLDETDVHYEVNHIDGEKLNNNLTNLEYCTSSENTIHAINNGLKKVFGNDYTVELTVEQVKTIKSMSDCSVNEIRKAIGEDGNKNIANKTIQLIRDGFIRKNIQ